MSFDPFERTEKVRKAVCKNDKRKYYRFRDTEFYSGCATADTVGCNLFCAYCWVNEPRKKPKEIGDFYSPNEVIEKLLNMDRKVLRITGGEPTICREHLLKVIDKVPEEKLFILETNGLLLGKDSSYVKNIKKSNVLVRLSLKGVDPDSFERITGADSKSFKHQMKALEHLKDLDINRRVAIIPRLFRKKKLKDFLKKIVSIDPYLSDKIEFEDLKEYPHVKKEMDKRGVEKKW